MNPRSVKVLLGGAAIAVLTALPSAQAATQLVTFNVLNATATVGPTINAGDTLILDTVVTTEVGLLNQQVTFTLGSNVASLGGQAAWEIDTAAGTGPRLIGVNIDIFDATNTLVLSDTFAGTLAGFAHSTFAGSIAPGTYKMVATGTGVRDSVLDVSLSFAAVPEPTTALFATSFAFLAGRRRVR